MRDFVYGNQTELLFGKDKERLVGQRLKQLGAKKVLIVYGRGSVVKSGLLDKIKGYLNGVGVGFIEYGGICANPSKGHALAGVEFAKKEKADFVLAVGGGSVIDEAKCIAAGAVCADVWKYYESGREKPFPDALPVAVVLTIPAAGSEGSTATVIRDEQSGIKYAVVAECVRPRLAFVNPENCFSLPKSQIANGASDILAHLLERYFSPQTGVVLTDKLLAAAIQAMMVIAPKVYAENHSYENWSEFCLLGTLAHNGMLDMGRDVQDWATHNIENTFLSGIHNIAHGSGLAIVFPAWMKHVSKIKPAKILQFAHEVMGAAGETDEETIANGIARLEGFYRSLGLPIRLSDVGIAVDKLQKMVSALYPKSIALGGYGKLGVCDIEAILGLAASE